jgi:hypothetical protein
MAFEHVDAYVSELGGRRLAAGEWGLEAEGFEIGLRVSRGLLRAQCWAVAAGAWEPAELLHRNRSLELVRYATTRAGDVWVVGEIVASGDAPVDRLLGALVEAAQAARVSSR